MMINKVPTVIVGFFGCGSGSCLRDGEVRRYEAGRRKTASIRANQDYEENNVFILNIKEGEACSIVLNLYSYTVLKIQLDRCIKILMSEVQIIPIPFPGETSMSPSHSTSWHGPAMKPSVVRASKLPPLLKSCMLYAPEYTRNHSIIILSSVL